MKPLETAVLPRDVRSRLGSCSACALTVMCCLAGLTLALGERLHCDPNRLFRNGVLWTTFTVK
jgi:hypothetical protein